MNIDTTDGNRLGDFSNVLLLAPMTPTGNRACLELLEAITPPEEANVVAMTYTQSPETWISDWEALFPRLPAELAFIYANTVESTVESGEHGVPPAVSVSRVDPNQPMDVIAPLGQQLTRWADNGNRTLISVQTLSILLEYVDFDAAFRYLNVLTCRVQAADAIGVYHVDPAVHDEETLDSLKTLFDAVVEMSDDGEEWSVTETRDDRSVEGEHVQSHDNDVSLPESERSMLASVRDALSEVFQMPEGAQSEEPGTSAAETAESGGGTETGPSGGGTEVATSVTGPSAPDVEEVSDEAILTDEDRIQELLARYGGRMKQTDVTDETDWSKSTVSRKLSKMEEKGLITRVQVGRSNLVFLTGDEPETAKSPFEGETD